MVNTHKLLYLLPDVAYIAELSPGKKDHTFVLHSCKQLNAELIKNNKLQADKLLKLFEEKLEEGEDYHLVLPDNLFINTILTIKETSEAKIKAHVKDEVLPGLKIDDDSHHIETSTLTEFKGTAKVQLSAIDKSILSILRAVATKTKKKIAGFSPLSWTLKAAISLEPSVSVVQMGETLFTAQQYIGVEQTSQTEVGNPNAVAETIKTLKGSEPSLQTVYLMTNSVVEDTLKELLKDTIPLQQTATDSDSDSKLPSYVQFAIETAQRTLSIPDFPVPTFKLDTATPDELAELEKVASSAPATLTKPVVKEAELPKPTGIADSVEPAEESPEEQEEEEESEEIKEITEEVTSKEKDTEPQASNETPEPEDKAIEDSQDSEGTNQTVEVDESKNDTTVPSQAPALSAVSPVVVGATENALPLSTKTKETDEDSTEKPVPTPSNDDKIQKETEKSSPELAVESKTDTNNNDIETGVDLSQFSQKSSLAETPNKEIKHKKTIKNSSGVSNMLKMILITLGVFIVTVAVGIGVGLAVLRYTGQENTEEQQPAVLVEATPTPEATPEPVATESASLSDDEKAAIKILVVNATSTAGLAGTVADELEAEGFTDVSAANAKGEYEEGNYVLLAEEDETLVEALSEATGLDLEVDTENKNTEDAADAYQAVIVLNE